MSLIRTKEGMTAARETLWHECGHALAAVFFGVRIRDLIISPVPGAGRITFNRLLEPDESLSLGAIVAIVCAGTAAASRISGGRASLPEPGSPDFAKLAAVTQGVSASDVATWALEGKRLVYENWAALRDVVDNFDSWFRTKAEPPFILPGETVEQQIRRAIEAQKRRV